MVRAHLPIAAAAAFLVLAGCAGRVEPVRRVETVRVEVPVAVPAVPPAALLAPVQPDLPAFVAPADPAATSALTADGEKRLKLLIDTLLARLDAWRAWAEPAPGTAPAKD